MPKQVLDYSRPSVRASRLSGLTLAAACLTGIAVLLELPLFVAALRPERRSYAGPDLFMVGWGLSAMASCFSLVAVFTQPKSVLAWVCLLVSLCGTIGPLAIIIRIAGQLYTPGM
jgi:hypothetical protein